MGRRDPLCPTWGAVLGCSGMTSLPKPTFFPPKKGLHKPSGAAGAGALYTPGGGGTGLAGNVGGGTGLAADRARWQHGIGWKESQVAAWDWSGIQMAEGDWLRRWGCRTQAGCSPCMMLWGGGDALWERGDWGGMQPLEQDVAPPGQRYKGRCSAPPSLQTAPLPGPLGWGQGQPQGCHVPIPSPNYPLTHRIRTTRENTLADSLLPHLWDVPNPHISDPTAAQSHPAQLQPHRRGLTQLRRVRACSIPPATEPWLHLITQEPSRRISCEKLPAVGCRGEGGM